MRIWFIATWLFFSLHGNSTDLFEDAVQLIKKYEGWHHARDQPYVGYGHRLLPTDTFDSDISESFADSILRNDLKKKCAVFRRFGADSLLLGILAFNVGENRVLRSKLVKKLETGRSRKSICLLECIKARSSGLWKEDEKRNMTYYSNN